jgi:hypothetical protein
MSRNRLYFAGVDLGECTIVRLPDGTRLFTLTDTPRMEETMDVSMKLNIGRQHGGLAGPTTKAPGRAELKLSVKGGTAEQLEAVADIAGECAERIAGAIGIEGVTTVSDDRDPGQR